MIDPRVDAAHVDAPLAMDQGESSWLCAEVASDRRHLGVLAWLHRTGPRLGRLAPGPGVLDRNQLPARIRDLVPAWLPILTPVRVQHDDRPLLMIAVFDLDRPELPPYLVEHEVEHAAFDATTFSGATPALSLRTSAERIIVAAETSSFALHLEARSTKPAVQFGDGSPILRHGDIEVGYWQRSRLDVGGWISLDGERHVVAGEGAHDRHWRRWTVPNLAWLWLHLRLDRAREVNCYVIRDARTRAEIARGGWWIDPDGAVTPLDTFELVERAPGFAFEAPALDLRVPFTHATRRPYLRMRAFGDAIDGGILEGPIRADNVAGWLEVFDAATCRITS